MLNKKFGTGWTGVCLPLPHNVFSEPGFQLWTYWTGISFRLEWTELGLRLLVLSQFRSFHWKYVFSMFSKSVADCWFFCPKSAKYQQKFALDIRSIMARTLVFLKRFFLFLKFFAITFSARIAYCLFNFPLILMNLKFVDYYCGAKYFWLIM